jgi:hypothetical protein
MATTERPAPEDPPRRVTNLPAAGLLTVPGPAPVDECASRDAEPCADCHSYAKPGTAVPQNADNRTQGRSKREADPSECGHRGHRGESTAQRRVDGRPTLRAGEVAA